MTVFKCRHVYIYLPKKSENVAYLFLEIYYKINYWNMFLVSKISRYIDNPMV